jgi:hypothetical protein
MASAWRSSAACCGVQPNENERIANITSLWTTRILSSCFPFVASGVTIGHPVEGFHITPVAGNRE